MCNLLKWVDEGAVEVCHLVVPALHGPLPAAGEVAKPEQVLSHLEAGESAAVWAVVSSNALVSPCLGFHFKLVIIRL